MNLIDVLDLYRMEERGRRGTLGELDLMLQDYVLDSRVERDSLNRIIIKELGAMTPIATSTVAFKFLLETFFEKYEGNISALIDTMYYEYNPLSDRHITITEKEGIDITENENTTVDRDVSDTHHENNTTTDSGTTTNTVSAYDSSGYQPQNQTTSSNTNSQTINTNGSEAEDIKNTRGLTSDNDRDLSRTESGFTGNVTYQSLIKQERELAEFNIFTWIIKQMRKELFLLVY